MGNIESFSRDKSFNSGQVLFVRYGLVLAKNILCRVLIERIQALKLQAVAELQCMAVIVVLLSYRLISSHYVPYSSYRYDNVL